MPRKPLLFIACFLLLACPLRAEDTDAFAESTQQFEFAGGLLSRGLHEDAIREYSAFLKAYPQDKRAPEALLWRGEGYFRIRDYAKSANDFYSYLTNYPGANRHPFGRLRYGCCLFEMKKYALAVSALEPMNGLTEDEHMRQTAAYYLGLCYYNLKQYRKALDTLEKITTGEMAPDAHFARAETVAATGDHVAAADLFTQFVKQWPDHAKTKPALLRQGEELRIAGKLKAAAESFLGLIERSGNETGDRPDQARYGLAWVRYAQGDFAAARSLAAKIGETREDDLGSDARYLLGLSALQTKDYAAAETAFRTVTTGSFVEKACQKYAWSLLASGHAENALRAVETCAAKYPDSSRGELEYIAGKALALQKEWKKAVIRFEEARNAKKEYHAEAAYELAYCYDALGDYEKTAEAYLYFIDNFPADERLADALIGRAGALTKLKQYEAALAVYGKLLTLKNADKKVREHTLNQQAVCYYWLKQFGNMQKCYAQLLEEFPKGESAPEAIYWLAWYESSEKRFARAAELYGQLVAGFPEHALSGKARYRQAMALFQEGEKDQAAAALFLIVTKFPAIQVDQKEILWLGQHMMKKGQLDQAYEAYEALLSRQPSSKVRAISLYQQAELRRQAEKWPEALAKYDRLLAERNTGLENASLYGRAVCLRNLGLLTEARTSLGKIALLPGDPLAAYYHFELGLLDFAEKRFDEATSHLMRVGLLYDSEDLCGEALLKAGEACLASGNAKKARICYEELAGGKADSFGARYPKNKFAEEARKRLAEPSATGN
jgi:TolA-binding protein